MGKRIEGKKDDRKGEWKESQKWMRDGALMHSLANSIDCARQPACGEESGFD